MKTTDLSNKTIGILASVITIFVFVTGITSLDECINKPKPGYNDIPIITPKPKPAPKPQPIMSQEISGTNRVAESDKPITIPIRRRKEFSISHSYSQRQSVNDDLSGISFTPLRSDHKSVIGNFSCKGSDIEEIRLSIGGSLICGEYKLRLSDFGYDKGKMIVEMIK